MLARVALVFCLLALLAPAAAVAQGQSPFTPLPPAQTLPQDQPVQTSNSTTTDGGGLQGWQQALIFAAGGILLLGIGWAIVADARGRAPVEPETPGVHDARERAEEDRHRRKQQARARAKRAKQARRKNRV